MVVSINQELASGEREHKAYGILLKAIEEAKVTDYPITFLMRALENVEARPSIVRALVAAQVNFSPIPAGDGFYVASTPDVIPVTEMLDLIEQRGYRIAEDIEINVFNECLDNLALKPFEVLSQVLIKGQAILCFEDQCSNVVRRQKRQFSWEGFGTLGAFQVLIPEANYYEVVQLVGNLLREGEVIATWNATKEHFEDFVKSSFPWPNPLVVPVGGNSPNARHWHETLRETKPRELSPQELSSFTLAKDTNILVFTPATRQ